MTNIFLTGSICLTDIPKELIKEYNGKKYLNVAVGTRKEAKTFTNKDGSSRTLTHYMTCAPRQDQRKEGVNYFIADFEERNTKTTSTAPSVSDIDDAQTTTKIDDLPF